jgi:hypothetical protein
MELCFTNPLSTAGRSPTRQAKLPSGVAGDVSATTAATGNDTGAAFRDASSHASTFWNRSLARTARALSNMDSTLGAMSTPH